jgi:hypothetical protein
MKWAPWSEVSWVGTPYIEINLAMRVSAQVAAAMSRIGNASNHREDLSTIVNRYLLPQVTHNVHMNVGEPSGCDGDGLHRCLVLPGGLGPSHCWQSRHQAATLLLSSGHITKGGISHLVACDPAWAKLWKAINTAAALLSTAYPMQR